MTAPAFAIPSIGDPDELPDGYVIPETHDHDTLTDGVHVEVAPHDFLAWSTEKSQTCRWCLIGPEHHPTTIWMLKR